MPAPPRRTRSGRGTATRLPRRASARVPRVDTRNAPAAPPRGPPARRCRRRETAPALGGQAEAGDARHYGTGQDDRGPTGPAARARPAHPGTIRPATIRDEADHGPGGGTSTTTCRLPSTRLPSRRGLEAREPAEFRSRGPPPIPGPKGVRLTHDVWPGPLSRRERRHASTGTAAPGVRREARSRSQIGGRPQPSRASEADALTRRPAAGAVATYPVMTGSRTGL